MNSSLTKAVMPPPGSFSAIPLTRIDAENRAPIWVSAQSGNASQGSSLSSLEEGLLKVGESVTYAPRLAADQENSGKCGDITTANGGPDI